MTPPPDHTRVHNRLCGHFSSSQRQGFRNNRRNRMNSGRRFSPEANYGSEDFQHLMQQAECIADKLVAAGGDVERLVLNGCNHFTASYSAGDPGVRGHQRRSSGLRSTKTLRRYRRRANSGLAARAQLAGAGIVCCCEGRPLLQARVPIDDVRQIGPEIG